MQKNDLWQLYDDAYSNGYNERYLCNPYSKVTTDVELQDLKKIIRPDTKWLDLGCGTGFFLSQFPGIQRAGLDYSPGMIKLAAQANPDAMFFKEGDFRIERPEWQGAWDLVTCMWAAYSYVDSIQEVEKLVNNMINWTATGGCVFLPVIDIEDLRLNVKMPYEEDTGIFGGRIAITGVTWTWLEESGKLHEHLVAPHIVHFIKMLEPYFEKIEILRYPPYMANWLARKTIMAKGKRPVKDDSQPAEIFWHPVPDAAVETPREYTYNAFRAAMAPISSKHMITEMFFRMRSGVWLKSLARKIKHKFRGK